MKSARYLDAGKALLKKKDVPRAILQFRNALQATPDKAEVYFQLGEAYTQGNDVAQALADYQKTLELDAGHRMAKIRIAEMMASSSDPQIVKTATADLKEILKQSGDPEVLNTLAFAQLRLGEVEDALASLKDASEKSPNDLGTASLEAAAMLIRHDPSQAEAILLDISKKNPRSAQAHRVLGDYYASIQKIGEAEAQFRAALALDPQFAAVLLDLAKLQLGEKRTGEAGESLQKLAKFPEYRSMHAVFLFQQGQRDQALGELEKLSKADPEDRAIRSNLVLAYRAMGHADRADQLLVRALKINSKDADALSQRAEIALERSDYATAETDLNQAVTLRPEVPEVHYLLARLHQAKGEALLYRQELREALNINPKLISVRVELARNLSSTESGAKAAVALLDAAPSNQKDLQAILIQRNWALWTLGDLASLRKGIDLGLSRERSPELLIQSGLLKLRSGDAAGARALEEEALKLDPNDLRAVEALSQSYLAEKNSDVALRKVRDFAGAHPKSAAAQDYLGVLLMAEGNKQQARTAFETAKAADPTFAKSDLALVQVDASESKFEDARKRLEGVLAANANNVTANLWLGNIEIVLNQRDAAIQHFRKVVAADPQNAQAANNLAYLLSEANQHDEALRYAEKAVNLAPNKPIYSDTMGWTLFRKGRYSEAVSYLERAAADKTGDVVWTYHLAMAYAKAGKYDRGRMTLAVALKVNPNVPEAKIARDMIEARP